MTITITFFLALKFDSKDPRGFLNVIKISGGNPGDQFISTYKHVKNNR
jgi:hypothetical protein